MRTLTALRSFGLGTDKRTPFFSIAATTCFTFCLVVPSFFAILFSVVSPSARWMTAIITMICRTVSFCRKRSPAACSLLAAENRVAKVCCIRNNSRKASMVFSLLIRQYIVGKHYSTSP